MKRSLRLIAALLTLCVMATALPPVGLAAGEGDLREGYIDLRAELDAAQAGSTITLTGDAEVSAGYLDTPWIISKNITIDGQGHSIMLRPAGILLDADVTFRNVDLRHVHSSSRNAIIANGHTLTLDRVTAGAHSINLFCGTLLPADYEDYLKVPAPGGTGTVIIQGKTNLQGSDSSLGSANLFAGSLCMGGMDADHNGPNDNGPANNFSGDAVIDIRDSGGNGALGTVYAGGGQQRIPVGASSGKMTAPDAAAYTVSGSVTVTGAKIPDVDGAGASTVDVIYQGSGNEATQTFSHISSLSVESGRLVLTAGSSFRDSKSLSVASGAKLDLKAFTGRNLDVGAFHGEGYLLLDPNQTWRIDGSVTGTSKVAIDDTNNLNTQSTGLPVLGHTYIQAPLSSDGNFQLLPYANNPNVTLVRDSNGDWKATDGSSGETINRVTSFQIIPDTVSITMAEDADIQMDAVFEHDTPAALDFIPLTISVDGKDLVAKEDPEHDGYYIYPYQAGVLKLTVMDGALCVTPDRQYSAGTYKIQVTIPAKYNGAGRTLTDSVTLTVTGGGAPDPGPVIHSIAVSSTGHKTEYQVGEGLDVTDLTIEASYSDGTVRQLPVTADMVSGFDSSAPASGQRLTITYQGQTASYSVNITAGPQPGVTEYQVTLADAGSGSSGAGRYEAGAAVTVRAGSKSGYTFASWQPSGVTLADRTSPEIRFVMPDHDVTLLAVWQSSGPAPAEHSHVWAADWTINGTHHWHACTAAGCPIITDSEKDGYAAHTAGSWVIDQPATSTQNGSRHRSCTACGYMMEQGVLPATGSGDSSSSDRDSSSSGSSTTVRNPDGSTTVTQTNRNTGTVIETTRHPNGSKTVVETKKDGTVTTTDTAQDGSTVRTEVQPGGTVQTTVKRADGLAASVLADRDGAQAEIHLPDQVVQEGWNGAVTLPIPPLPGAGSDVTVHTGSAQPVQLRIPVEGSAATTVAYLVKEDGSASMVKTAVLAGGQMTIRVPDGATVQLRDNGKQFGDTGGHWAEASIQFAAARDLFLGTEGGAFRPDTTMTRNMLMTVLARLDGADTAGGSAYGSGIAWAVSQGISDGRNPEGQVTREQLVSMLYRYAGSPAATERELRFRDAPAVSGYAWDAICWAAENGILTGCGDGSIAPGAGATRAQAAAILNRYVTYLNQQ